MQVYFLCILQRTCWLEACYFFRAWTFTVFLSKLLQPDQYRSSSSEEYFKLSLFCMYFWWFTLYYCIKLSKQTLFIWILTSAFSPFLSLRAVRRSSGLCLWTRIITLSATTARWLSKTNNPRLNLQWATNCSALTFVTLCLDGWPHFLLVHSCSYLVSLSPLRSVVSSSQISPAPSAFLWTLTFSATPVTWAECALRPTFPLTTPTDWRLWSCGCFGKEAGLNMLSFSFMLMLFFFSPRWNCCY